ncbi:MAG: ATP-binding protein, partial [Candidatus Natronoplasma sp.]
QVHLMPLEPSTLNQMIKDPEKTVRLYSIFGGIPKYHEMIDHEKDFHQIVDSILRPESLFFEEGTFLLGQEFKELGNYNSIMKSISKGNTELSDIANEIGMETRKLSNYLDKLYELGFVRKERPITVTKKRYRGYHYCLKDNFLDFWFKFVFPNRSQIEERIFTHSEIRKRLKKFISKKFEDICRKEIAKTYKKVGKWWFKEDEIDIVGLDEEDRSIAFGECKWSKNKVDRNVLRKLKSKSEKVRWHDDDRDEKYYLFSRSGFTQELQTIGKKEEVVLNDLSFLKRDE